MQAQTLTSTQRMFLTSYSIAMVMQIFTPNYFATDVIENCELLPYQLFSSKWLRLKNIEQKGVLLFMTRTARPLAISAGSLFQMQINTFSKVFSFYLNNFKQLGNFFPFIDREKCILFISCIEKHSTISFSKIYKKSL